MPKKILLFSCDPGGANTILPLISPLKQQGWQVTLVGKDNSLVEYKNRQMDYLPLSQLIVDNSPQHVKQLVVKIQPDAIITGTSANDFTERYLWQAAQELGIYSAAILDQWINYGVRFSPYRVDQLTKYQQHPTHTFLPTTIFVMDEYARQEALQEGLPSKKIVISGQPHFQYLQRISPELTQNNNFKTTLGIAKNSLLVVFASEPIWENYQNYFGYTQYSINQILAQELCRLSGKHQLPISFIVKLHPRENCVNSKHKKLLDLSNHLFAVKMISMSNTLQLLTHAALVTGMSSMFLLEALALHRPTISVQIGLNRINPFVLARQSRMTAITDRQNLVTALEKILIKQQFELPELKLPSQPVATIINYLQQQFYG